MCMFCKTEKSAMESEIYEQPEILNSLLHAHIDKNGAINLDVPEDIKKIVLVASGSSYHCARWAADLFGKIARIEARAMYSSEFLLKSEIPHSSDILYIFVTQSGETSDTNQALNRAKEYSLRSLAVTNKKESTIWNAADYKIDCQAGEEKSIAATKSLTAQMLALALVVLKYAQIKGTDTSHIVKALETLPEALNNVCLEEVKKAAKFLSKFKSIVVAADGISYALAKEVALKIKETSYINANAIILGEFMHGHVAVLNNKKIPLIYVEQSDLSYTAIKNLNKIGKDYNPPLVVIGNTNNQVKTDFVLNINCESEIVKAFCVVVTEQLLALEIAKCLRRNVDKPKGLAKVVK